MACSWLCGVVTKLAFACVRQIVLTKMDNVSSKELPDLLKQLSTELQTISSGHGLSPLHFAVSAELNFGMASLRASLLGYEPIIPASQQTVPLIKADVVDESTSIPSQRTLEASLTTAGAANGAESSVSRPVSKTVERKQRTISSRKPSPPSRSRDVSVRGDSNPPGPSPRAPLRVNAVSATRPARVSSRRDRPVDDVPVRDKARRSKVH